MTAIATLSTPEETFPTFLGGGRSAGGVGVALRKDFYSTGIQPGGTAGVYVLASHVIPANTFNQIGVGGTYGPVLKITALGHFAATANNKTVAIYANATAADVGSVISGGTAILTTGVVAINNLGFVLTAYIAKTGLPNSKTQIGGYVYAAAGASVISPSLPVSLTADESKDIIVAVTGNAATAATDIVLDGFLIEALN